MSELVVAAYQLAGSKEITLRLALVASMSRVAHLLGPQAFLLATAHSLYIAEYVPGAVPVLRLFLLHTAHRAPQ